MGSITNGDNHHEDLNQSLLPESSTKDEDHNFKDLASRVWIESKKIWHIVGPAIFSRVASYSMNVITQAFAGHLGEVELASTSIAINVILGFCFGLMVIHLSLSFNSRNLVNKLLRYRPSKILSISCVSCFFFKL